jgi:outer membrane receptor protein involved in Fe transport
MNRLFLSFVFVFSAFTVPGLVAQESNLVLEEVVVTATKKEENVQDIAQTVYALSGDALEDYQIRDLGEISQLVSGVEFTRIDPRRATITMRGQKLDPDGGNDQPIQVYIDEMPVRPNVAFNTMYDTERVEVLKGTQGTLQGVVSVGGALHIYTRDATVGSDERNGYVKTTIADNATNMIEFASDFQISDTMALRVAGITNQSNGHEIKNIRTGVNENHQYDSYRLSLTWQPSDDLTARLKYTNMEGKFISPRPIAGSEGPITLNPAAYINPALAGFGQMQSFSSLAAAIDAVLAKGKAIETMGYLPAGTMGSFAIYRRPSLADISGHVPVGSGIAVHAINPLQNNSGENLNLLVDYELDSHVLSLRYSDYENDTQGIIDRDIIGALVSGSPQEVRTNAGITTFEVRISNTDDSDLQYTLGFFNRDSQTYTHADLDYTSPYLKEFAPMMTPLAVPDMYQSPFDACSAGENGNPFAGMNIVVYCINIPLDNETTAFFANFKYDLSEKSFIEFGVREQEIDVFTQQQNFLPLSNLVPVAASIEQIPVQFQNRSTESTTGNFKFGHFVEEDVLLYFAKETGVRSPGRTITPTAVSPDILLFNEEDTDMTEIGMKGLFLDGRLKLNIAYFQYDFEGFQTKWDGATARTYENGAPGATAQVQGGLFTNNDGELSGFDVEYQYIVNENLILGGSYSNNESEYGSGSVAYVADPTYTGMLAATADVTGQPLNDATENSWTFYLDHSVPFMDGERYTRYNINWRDSRKSIANPDISISELYLANLYFGYRSGDGVWDANFFIKNVLDDVDLTFISSYYSDYAIPGFGGMGTKFYEANTNMGRQVGLTITYNF